MGFDFEIQYRLGLENKAADALSMSMEGVSVAALSMPTLLDVTAITQQVDAYPYLCKVKQELLKDPDSYPSYSLLQGRLLYNGRLVVSKEQGFKRLNREPRRFPVASRGVSLEAN